MLWRDQLAEADLGTDSELCSTGCNQLKPQLAECFCLFEHVLVNLGTTRVKKC